MKYLFEYLPEHLRENVFVNSTLRALCDAIEFYIEERERQKENQEIWQAWHNPSS